jgi:hypothetical protein
LANSLVSSKLDYCNSLYYGISKHNLNKLQIIQNSLARAITFTSHRQHIKPILKEFHWLPIKQRIDYKISLLTYKSLQTQQPEYLYKLLVPKSHTYATRSSTSIGLLKPHIINDLGARAFFSSAPNLWTSLSHEIRSAPSIPTFCSKLKTHLFKQAYPSPVPP